MSMRFFDAVRSHALQRGTRLIEFLYLYASIRGNKVFDLHQDPFVHLALLSRVTRSPPS